MAAQQGMNTGLPVKGSESAMQQHQPVLAVESMFTPPGQEEVDAAAGSSLAAAVTARLEVRVCSCVCVCVSARVCVRVCLCLVCLCKRVFAFLSCSGLFWVPVRWWQQQCLCVCSCVFVYVNVCAFCIIQGTS